MTRSGRIPARREGVLGESKNSDSEEDGMIRVGVVGFGMGGRNWEDFGNFRFPGRGCADAFLRCRRERCWDRRRWRPGSR